MKTLPNPALSQCVVWDWDTAGSGSFDVVFASSSTFLWLKEVDWEVELAFVIGRRGKHIKVSTTTSPLMALNALMLWWNIICAPLLVQEEDALSYVAGFTVANDVSARDWQMKRNGNQWLLGKTFDSFCPLGPALVTTDGVKGEKGQEATAGSARHKGEMKENMVNHPVICDLNVPRFLRFKQPWWMWNIICMAWP